MSCINRLWRSSLPPKTRREARLPSILTSIRRRHRRRRSLWEQKTTNEPHHRHEPSAEWNMNLKTTNFLHSLVKYSISICDSAPGREPIRLSVWTRILLPPSSIVIVILSIGTKSCPAFLARVKKQSPTISVQFSSPFHTFTSVIACRGSTGGQVVENRYENKHSRLASTHQWFELWCS